MKNILNLVSNHKFNKKYLELRRKQKVSYSAFKNTPGTDKNSIYVRELAKKEYDIVSFEIENIKKEAALKKEIERRRKRLIA